MTRARVDHVGIAVRDIEDAEPLLELLGCEKLTETADEEVGYTWAYYALGDASRLELIEPLPDRESFLTDYLDEHGPGLHHVTLEVSDLDAMVARLEAGGVRVVDRADRDGYSEAFVSPREMGALVQLMEYRPEYAEAYGADMFVREHRLTDEDREEP
ncbi:MAG: VOC family protein [Haloarculaceae archaeon]